MKAATRRLVRERANARCEYCLLPQSASPFLSFHVEHIVAKQHFRDDRDANLCLACAHCNLHKGPNLVTLNEDGNTIVPLFNPREQEWTVHFSIEDGQICGLTIVGDATIRLLQMNAKDQVAIRKALIEAGRFY